MEFTIAINQKAVIENGLQGLLDLDDLAIFSFMGQFFKNCNTKKVKANNKIYHWLTYNKINAELPILNNLNKSSIGRKIKKLIDNGLVEKIVKDTHVFYRILEKGLNILPLAYRPVAKTQQRCCENATNHNTNNHKKDRTTVAPQPKTSNPLSPISKNKEKNILLKGITKHQDKIPDFIHHYRRSKQLRDYPIINEKELHKIATAIELQNIRYEDKEIEKAISYSLDYLKHIKKDPRTDVTDYPFYVYVNALRKLRSSKPIDNKLYAEVKPLYNNKENLKILSDIFNHYSLPKFSDGRIMKCMLVE